MKRLLVVLFISCTFVNYAQNPEGAKLKYGAALTVAFGDQQNVGASQHLFFQRNRLVLQLFRTSKNQREFPFTSKVEETFIEITQVGVLAGYDFANNKYIHFSLLAGISAGQATWRGEKIFNAMGTTSYNLENYDFVGVPLRLNFETYIGKNVGINLYAGGTFQKHLDPNFGFGLVFGKLRD